MSSRAQLLALLVLPLAWVLPSTPAGAEFTPATLLSGDGQLQFDEADSPALSRDGRYVVFRGSLAGVPGIYRRDLQTGEVQLVAGGAYSDPEHACDAAVHSFAACDASAPSISSDGRYVAFTSAADLDPSLQPVSDAGCPEVYVRDMALTWKQVEEHPEGAYTLASAVNGSREGLTYSPGCPAGSATQLAPAGAQAAAGVALSANGRRVAFTVLSPSDLTGSCVAGPPVSCPTEPSQVAVRDLDAQTTTLVSATPTGQPTPGGGAFPSTQSAQRLGNGASIEGPEPTASSAAISGDGTAVAWQGTNVPAQVPSAGDVTAGMAALGGAALEVEPLWRRFASGAGAATRRLLGEAGLNLYFTPSHQISNQAIEGGALQPASRLFVPPVVSENGDTVATIANAPTSTNEGSYRFLEGMLPPAEAYAIRLTDDPAAPPWVTPLTATPDFAVHNAAFDGAGDVAVSADGSTVAFNTRRVTFALASPTPISPPAPEVAFAYTYEVNLAQGTLQRVTSTYEGAPPNGEPGLLSLSGDGLSLAFASSASNLFYGDATPGVSQVYATAYTQEAEQLSAQSTSAAPLTQLPVPPWLLSATALAARDGSVLVYAEVPGAGRLTISAASQLPAPAHHRRTGARARPRRSAFGLLTRTVARATTIAGGPAELRVRLRVGAAYRALVASRKGLYAVLRVTFAAARRSPLAQSIPVTFHAAAPRRTAKRAAHGLKAGSRLATGAGG